MTRFNEHKEETRLASARKEEAEELAELLAKRYDLPYTDLSIVPVSIDALTTIPEKEAREAKVASFAKQGNKVSLALFTPNNEHAQAIIKWLKARKFVPELFITSEISLEKAWERYREIVHAEKSQEGVVEVSEKVLSEFSQKIADLADVARFIADEIAGKKAGETTKALDIIIAGSIATKASDIHIEPEEKIVRIRYRLDGVLQEVGVIDHSMYQFLISRIKLVSGLKLNITKTAQDGRFTIRLSGGDIEIRTSILPGSFGESGVLRLLDPKTVLSLSLERLGMEQKFLDIIQEEIKKPNGMILNTGPTGSGKTTTLYAFLNTLNHPGIKIITIENPIEYHLSGITQTQTGKGYGFVEGLRSALRQDPDVIMVGEIRDSETAKVAINASLTGHLVLSTLHTNNAAGAFPRLLDLGVDIKVLGDAMTICMAQRLVRILCEKCKKKYLPNEKELELIQHVIASMPASYQKNIPDLGTVSFFEKGDGCAECHHTGYRGREGVFEMIKMDKAIEDAILTRTTEREIWLAAKKQELLRMKEHGILKVLSGTTDLAELSRVVDLVEE